MKKKGKRIGMLIAMLVIFLIHGKKQVLLDEKDSRVLNSTFLVVNPDRMDKTRQRKRYAYTTDIDNVNIAAIIYRSHKASMKQYLLKRGEAKTLTMPRDSKLARSLPVYTGSTPVWAMEDESGGGYGRKNYSLTPLKAGTRRIRFVYQQKPSIATPENSEGWFLITISIRAQP